MGKQLESLIKRAMEVIQSLLILVPPLVVDCSSHPDIVSGAYPGKKVAGFTSAHYVTTQSALFYSYEGESEARTGEFSSTTSIREDVLSKFLPSFRSDNEDENLNSHTSLEEKNISVEDHTQRDNVPPDVMSLARQDGKDTNEEEYEQLSLGIYSSAAIAEGHSMNTALTLLQSTSKVHSKVECEHRQTQTDFTQNYFQTEITSEVKYLFINSQNPLRQHNAPYMTPNYSVPEKQLNDITSKTLKVKSNCKFGKTTDLDAAREERRKVVGADKHVMYMYKNRSTQL